MPREQAVLEIEYKKHTIKIFPDDGYDSPNEWGDEDTFLVHYHRDCWIECKKHISEQDVKSWFWHKRDALNQLTYNMENMMKDWWVFPVSAYIHSGVSLSLNSRFSCDQQGWDTSNVGMYFVRKKAEKKWRWRKYAMAYAEGQIETWNDYLSGNVYYFVVENSDGETVDSCHGFYGDYSETKGNDSDVVTEAKSIVDYEVTKKLKEHTAYLKSVIKNKVNISHREASGF